MFGLFKTPEQKSLENVQNLDRISISAIAKHGADSDQAIKAWNAYNAAFEKHQKTYGSNTETINDEMKDIEKRLKK